MTIMDEIKIVAQSLHEEVVMYNDTGEVQDEINASILLAFSTRLGDRWWEYDARFDRDKFMEWVLNGVPGGFPS